MDDEGDNTCQSNVSGTLRSESEYCVERMSVQCRSDMKVVGQVESDETRGNMCPDFTSTTRLRVCLLHWTGHTMVSL